MFQGLARGQEIELNFSEGVGRKIVCGLSWDPIKESGESEHISALSGRSSNAHDLDLLCAVFDKYGRLIEGISGEAGMNRGGMGTIYHTGDVVDGTDNFDDEQINVELFNLPRKVHQLFFIAEIHSSHSFSDINSPQIRIANAIDNKNLFLEQLGVGYGAKESAYVFGCLTRTKSGGWVFKYINEYYGTEEVTDWAETLARHIDAEEPPPGGLDAMENDVGQGEPVPLRYTKEARHRVICGLSWDPLEDSASLAEQAMGKIQGQNVNTFDLDLACIMFNNRGEPVDGVSGRPDETIDQSGKIYHTGDDESGVGEDDDEQVSIELKDLPDHIQHVIFLIEIQSTHTFGDVNNPQVRIADAMSMEEQLIAHMGRSEASKNKDAYVFARIYRGGDGAWMLHFINEYYNGAAVEDWFETLRKYTRVSQ